MSSPKQALRDMCSSSVSGEEISSTFSLLSFSSLSLFSPVALPLLPMLAASRHEVHEKLACSGLGAAGDADMIVAARSSVGLAHLA